MKKIYWILYPSLGSFKTHKVILEYSTLSILAHNDCENCGKEFFGPQAKKDLSNHLKEHQEWSVSKNPFKCNKKDCNFETGSDKRLEQHLKCK